MRRVLRTAGAALALAILAAAPVGRAQDEPDGPEARPEAQQRCVAACREAEQACYEACGGPRGRGACIDACLEQADACVDRCEDAQRR